MNRKIRFHGWFTWKRSLNRVKTEELKREKIRLSQEESKLSKRIEILENEKSVLFLKGKEEGSRRQQMIIARKIKELDSQAKGLDKTVRLFSNQIRILNGFLQLKENKELLKNSGVSRLLSGMKMRDLEEYVGQATVDGEFHTDKFLSIINTLEEGDRLEFATHEDPDTIEIVGAMEEARLAGGEDTEIGLDQGLKRVDEILNRQPVAEQA